MNDNDWSEHYIKRGDPSKLTYYIIRQNGKVGLLSNFITTAGHISNAFINGWLPVVNMQNYPNPYLPPEKFGKENVMLLSDRFENVFAFNLGRCGVISLE